MDPVQLFQQSTTRVQDSDLERPEIVVLAEVCSCGFQYVAEEASDRDLRVRIRAAPYTHLQQHTGRHDIGGPIGGGIADPIGAVHSLFRPVVPFSLPLSY